MTTQVKPEPETQRQAPAIATATATAVAAAAAYTSAAVHGVSAIRRCLENPMAVLFFGGGVLRHHAPYRRGALNKGCRG